MRLLLLLLALQACGDSDEGTVCTPDNQDVANECDRYDCTGVAACDATCETGHTCGTIDCKGIAECRLDCQEQATCTKTDCRNTGNCFVDCHGSTCETLCDGSTDCAVSCRGGAQCVLDCGSSTNCQFMPCEGGSVTECPNHVLVCNRPCP